MPESYPRSMFSISRGRACQIACGCSLAELTCKMALAVAEGIAALADNDSIRSTAQFEIAAGYSGALSALRFFPLAPEDAADDRAWIRAMIAQDQVELPSPT